MARGDHLYVKDTMGGIPFQHHGIDMGDDTVIHLAPIDGSRVTLRDASERFAVRRVSLKEFSNGRPVKVRQHAQRQEVEVIVKTAESMIGKAGYSLLEGNCEHFASLCVTGKSTSYQIDMAEATLASVASACSKAFWTASARLGTKLVVRGVSKIHPATLVADGVEIVALNISCRRGMSAEEAKRIARRSGNVAALGIGAILGGPVGAAVGLAAHTSSRNLADRICQRVRKLLR
jgi:Lecithin retinol acyltransferase